jgi:protein phosphatase
MKAKMCEMIQSILNTCFHGTPGSSQFATSAQVLSIISQAVDIFSAHPPLLILSGQFTVVGDIHGNILSLVRIFQKLGWPDSRRYVLLGDYVDRGESSCEVLVLLYCLKVIFPENIFLLRGNHEFESMTRVYGFKAECTSKFIMKVYSEFVNSFMALPIAAILNESIFCAHGGISPDLAAKLDDLTKICDSSPSFELNILWSDPCEDVEGFKPSPRGRGFLFGSNAFETFLENSELTMMIRSHEDCQNGFTWSFGDDGKLLTVFSTVDYCGKGNDGAVAVVNGSDVNIVRFPFRKAACARMLVPFFVLEQMTVALSNLPLIAQEEESHLCIETF